jgi:hypothetical protein
MEFHSKQSGARLSKIAHFRLSMDPVRDHGAEETVSKQLLDTAKAAGRNLLLVERIQIPTAPESQRQAVEARMSQARGAFSVPT